MKKFPLNTIVRSYLKKQAFGELTQSAFPKGCASISETGFIRALTKAERIARQRMLNKPIVSPPESDDAPGKDA